MKNLKNENIYRYERKFLITDLDRNTVEKIIKLNTMNFKILYPQRQINNIYFDTTKMKCFHDNIEGNANREKYRIRWYGDLYGHIKKPILEKKIRKNSTGTKDFYPLAPFNIEKNSTNKDFSDVFQQSKLPSLVKEKLFQYSSKIISGYNRKYFISFDKKFRITLDNDLFYIKSGSHKTRNLGEFTDRKSTVLEIKYNIEDDERLELITKQFNFRLTKNSKYVTGVYRQYY